MRIPGFAAERTLARSRGGRMRFGLHSSSDRIRPAALIQVDGVDYCQGEVSDGAIQCYPDSGGGGNGGGRGGGGGGGPTCVPHCGPCRRNRRGGWQKACTGSNCSVTLVACSPFGEVTTGPISSM
jgi:hypothetical protein